jgi:hypothetical protein
LALLFAGSALVGAGGYSYPYYSNNTWYSASYSGQTYYYSQCYYAPNRYHYAYYYPYVSTRYVYYYNHYNRRYWGRFDTQTNKYSLLPENARKEKLDDIKESDFPTPQALNEITIPDSDVKMKAPPALPAKK